MILCIWVCCFVICDGEINWILVFVYLSLVFFDLCCWNKCFLWMEWLYIRKCYILVYTFEVWVNEISIFMFALNADEKILIFVCLSLMILYNVTLKLLLVWDVLMNLGEICNLCSWDKCLCKLSFKLVFFVTWA